LSAWPTGWTTSDRRGGSDGGGRVLLHARPHDARLLSDEVVDYENVHRLCYIRGPEGILIGLAQNVR